jgi:hypothetical protein
MKRAKTREDICKTKRGKRKERIQHRVIAYHLSAEKGFDLVKGNSNAGRGTKGYGALVGGTSRHLATQLRYRKFDAEHVWSLRVKKEVGGPRRQQILLTVAGLPRLRRTPKYN